MLIAQITDFHVLEPGERMSDRVDTASGLRAAIELLHTIAPRPDLVVATGDLTNDGSESQYRHLAQLLEPLEIPIVAIPGNHDDRRLMRVHLAEHLPGSDPHPDSAEPIRVIEDRFPVRVIGLDSTVPGAHHGSLGTAQLDWLDQVLSADAERPTIVIQHHPPFRTGIDWMDDVGLIDAKAEAAVIERHPQVLAVLAGHVHRCVVRAFANTVASCWPSTGAQVALALDGTRYEYVDEAPAVAIHRWSPDDGLVSHLQPVIDAPRWRPAWALGRTRIPHET